MDKKLPTTIDQNLLVRICDIWEASRTQAIRTVNSTHVCANWLIGKQIVEAEQRAGYDKTLLRFNTHCVLNLPYRYSSNGKAPSNSEKATHCVTFCYHRNQVNYTSLIRQKTND